MRTRKDFEQYLKNIQKIAAEEGYESLDETYVKHLECRYFDRDVVIGRTERITLRELKKDDFQAIYAFEDGQNEEVLRVFLKDTPEASYEYLQAYIAHMYPMCDYGIWAVVRNEDEQLIGLCGIGNPDIAGAECTDLGYYICSKCRNQGFATEAIEIVLDYAKNYLEFPLICAIIKEENRISEGILRKFGFTFQKQCMIRKQKVSVYEKVLTE